MNPLKEQYAELLALTQLYLLHEFPEKAWIPVSMPFYQWIRATHQPPPKTASIPSTPIQPAATQPTPLPTPPSPLPAPAAPKKAEAPPQHTPTPPKPAPQKAPEPIPPPQKTEATPRSFFTLEPMTQAVESDLTDIQTILAERFPKQTILKEVPSDTESNLLKKEHTTEAAILLSFLESPEHLTFLTNIAKAIESRLAPAAVVAANDYEQDDRWHTLLQSPALRAIIISSANLQALPKLMKHYREDTTQKKFFLGQVPLVVLSDISLYFQEPTRKRALWDEITKVVGNNKRPDLHT